MQERELMEGKAEVVTMKPNGDELLCKKRMKQEAAAATKKEEIQMRCDDTITEQEMNKIELMRALVEKQDPSIKVLYNWLQHCSISLTFLTIKIDTS